MKISTPGFNSMRSRLSFLTLILVLGVYSATVQAQEQPARKPGAPATETKAHASANHAAKPEVPSEAVAVLIPTQGNQVKGEILLRQQGEVVHITGKVINLSPGEHGFHIHEFGDLRSTDGDSAGGHYSPEGHKHGGPEDKEHHAGDLGNITANADGVATIDKQSKDLKVHFAIGRSIVVHADADDLKSQPSGAAGARVAVGVIGFANPEPSPSPGAPVK